MQEHFPLNVSVICHAQLENKLSVVFGTSDTKESICDVICNQWMAYQNEPLCESYYLCQKKPTMSARSQYSYWKYDLEKCGLQQKEIRNSPCKRIDHFWSKVGEITDDNGCKKYPQLFKCVFSLVHVDSVPEWGFLINKLLLEAHGYTMEGATVKSLRQVQGGILCVGGVMKFKIPPKLITEIKNAHAIVQSRFSTKRKNEGRIKLTKNKQLQMQLLDKRLKVR